MPKSERLMIDPQKLQLTTQQAAVLLNVSPPFLINEIEAGRLKCCMIDGHHRFEVGELMRHKGLQKPRSARALERLNELSHEMGEEL